VAVVSRRGRRLLPEIRDVVLGSALAAMAAHLVVALLGLGASDTYYGVGEKLGFASRSPAEMSLLAVVVAGAALAAPRRTDVRIALFSVAALPAVLTGVRAALVSVVLILALYTVRSRLSVRTVAVLAVALAVFFVSGAADTVTARFAKEASSYSSFRTVGSGRGAIWDAAVSSWAEAGAQAWLFGTGLQSVAAAQLKELGAAFVGHSDIIEVTVQLGVVGLLSWLLIWLGLVRARLSTFVLVPIGVYIVLDGTIEFVAPLTVGLVLAAACSEEGRVRRRRATPQGA
jgi:O-Antigen ligase